jgi:hypothetical protein
MAHIEDTIRNLEFKIQWNCTNRRWLQAELEYVNHPDNISKWAKAPEALNELIIRSSNFLEEAKAELRQFVASLRGFCPNAMQFCYWHGCENVAFCASGNAGGALVCRTHFSITNGKAVDELEPDEAAAILRMAEIVKALQSL